MLFINHAVSLGYNIVASPSSTLRSILPPIFYLILILYMIALTSSSITTTEVDEHWPIVIHLSALSALSLLAQCVSVLVPNDGTISISSDASILSLGRVIITQIYHRSDADQNYDDEMNGFWYSSLFLTLFVTIIATTMPRGPDRYFPPERVYTIKSLEVAARERGELESATSQEPGRTGHQKEMPKNVCGIVASSVLGSFFPCFHPIYLLIIPVFRIPAVRLYDVCGHAWIYGDLSGNRRSPHSSCSHACHLYIFENEAFGQFKAFSVLSVALQYIGFPVYSQGPLWYLSHLKVPNDRKAIPLHTFVENFQTIPVRNPSALAFLPPPSTRTRQ